MENDCPICFDDLNNNEETINLNCSSTFMTNSDHIFHKDCINDMIINNTSKCPLCRENNTHITKPFKDPKENIKILTFNDKKCSCITKKGSRCKYNRKLLNYGYCHIHNKEVLQENFYPLMERVCQQKQHRRPLTHKLS